MRRRYFIAFGLLLCGFAALPARAQIVSYTDASGKRVFINANPKPLPRRSPLAAKSTSTTTTSNASSPATPETSREAIETMIHDTSARYDVDPALIRAVIQTESNWNPTAVSTKDAQGLMQLIPSTAQQMGVNNAMDPKQNLDGGVHYLRTLLERYNGDLDRTLAAYNAGPGAVDRAGGVPRYSETRAYVRKVTSAYNQPGGNRALAASRPIYRAVSADGRVVFTNE